LKAPEVDKASEVQVIGKKVNEDIPSLVEMLVSSYKSPPSPPEPCLPRMTADSGYASETVRRSPHVHPDMAAAAYYPATVMLSFAHTNLHLWTK